jgi:hypothetical protein
VAGATGVLVGVEDLVLAVDEGVEVRGTPSALEL